MITFGAVDKSHEDRGLTLGELVVVRGSIRAASIGGIRSYSCGKGRLRDTTCGGSR